MGEDARTKERGALCVAICVRHLDSGKCEMERVM
jgi:hypothetical protein